jgi:hypothetical protein
VYVNDDNQFMRTWLKEQVLNVAEEDINCTAAVIAVAETVLVDLGFTSDTLAVEAWADKDVVEVLGLTT